MRTSPGELDWSPMVLNGNDWRVMGDNNSVELRWGTSAKMLQLRPSANALDSCWLGILLHPVTHWLNRSYRENGTRQRSINTNNGQLWTNMLFRNTKRKVSNCPLFSAEIMTWNVSWQVSPSRCSRGERERKNNKVCPWGDSLPDLRVVGSVHHQAREQSWLCLRIHPAGFWCEALTDLCHSGKRKLGKSGGVILWVSNAGWENKKGEQEWSTTGLDQNPFHVDGERMYQRPPRSLGYG